MLFGDYLTIASDPSFCKDVGNRMSLTVTDVILVGRDIFCLFVVQKGAGIQQTVWVRVFLGHIYIQIKIGFLPELKFADYNFTISWIKIKR